MINYYDIGAHYGVTLIRAEKIFREFGLEYRAYAFEPCKRHYEKLLDVLVGSRAEVINAACSDYDGKNKLYHCNISGGDSLKQSKHNVDGDKYEDVTVIKFSSWFDYAQKDDFNIVKINVEGSEFEVYKDIIESGLINHIDLFCGSLGDIYKIGKSKEEIKDFLDMLHNNNITVYGFTAGRDDFSPILRKSLLEVKEKIEEAKKTEELVVHDKNKKVVMPVKEVIVKKRGRPKVKK